jgi:hypothetical protein
MHRTATGQTVCSELDSVLNKYDLVPNRGVCIVTHGASAMTGIKMALGGGGGN